MREVELTRYIGRIQLLVSIPDSLVYSQMGLTSWDYRQVWFCTVCWTLLVGVISIYTVVVHSAMCGSVRACNLNCWLHSRCCNQIKWLSVANLGLILVFAKHHRRLARLPGTCPSHFVCTRLLILVVSLRLNLDRPIHGCHTSYLSGFCKLLERWFETWVVCLIGSLA